MKSLQNIAFVVNAQKAGAPHLAGELARTARAQGMAVELTEAYPIPEGFLRGMDACCVIGGDGSILSVVQQAVEYGVPVMGVNHGTLGFLTSYTKEEACEHFVRILKGEYRLSSRTLLDCRSCDGTSNLALNDIVVKNHSVRLIRVRVLADGELVNEYYADGLIFATPTGSTAYNLSAGGALIHPSARVISMTPICPHTLSNRSFIFSDERQLEVVLCNEEREILVTRDGRACIESAERFPLRIALSPHTFQLMENPAHGHFELVREKLHWGTDGT